ncbi:hypothetical protein K437DRAFT_266917 [Tilletiaria anomala UBC 951]|uniref:DUF833-domain-containing protein n=1 Tax=Tilletiaria anomala (strain ATCC 24038 / CBS 436.72 / UBC 951) TaxID=1037660 RepID=A0A066WM26_TILAU|nr:uncharacterized protein K437DRAFT_266917 [Tilletiaria anomala UBC 951]KDN52054.1 hypothetical protein K437DRAFT_266917 [Tilletiaria anomala UBC 951]
MCVIFTLTSHPDYALIIAANRDEFLKRPSAKAAWHSFPTPSVIALEHGASWQESLPFALSLPESLSATAPSATQPILSGIDAYPSGGGTWLGITSSGSFSVLTNFTETAPPPLPPSASRDTYRSRGALPRGWLKEEGMISASDAGKPKKTHSERLEEFLEAAGTQRMEYPGFNLFVGTIDAGSDNKLFATLGYLTNRDISSENVERRQPIFKQLAHGGKILDTSRPRQAGQAGNSAQGCLACGLSNSTLDDPWGKVLSGEKAMEEAVSASEEKGDSAEGIAESLFAMLRTSQSIQTRADVQDSICVPPLRLPVKSATSAAATDGDGHSAGLSWYATRIATVLIVPRDPTKEATWIERDVHVLLEGTGDKPVLLSIEQAKTSQRMYTWAISLRSRDAA